MELSNNINILSVGNILFSNSLINFYTMNSLSTLIINKSVAPPVGYVEPFDTKTNNCLLDRRLSSANEQRTYCLSHTSFDHTLDSLVFSFRLVFAFMID